MEHNEGESEGATASARWDRVLRCLADEERRQLVLSLAETTPDEWRMLPEAAISPNIEQDLNELEIRLLHEHLPYLAARNYVEWRADPLQVRQGSEFRELASVLNILAAHPKQLPDNLTQGCETLEQ